MVDYFSWKRHVAVVLLFLAVESAALNCNEIPENKPFSEWKDCNYAVFFGGWEKIIQLDFSTATQEEFNNFFAKTDNGKIRASIKIFGSDIKTIDFGKIEWTLRDDNDRGVIEIVGNPKLEKISFNLTLIPANFQIIIYSNPLLKISDDLAKNLTAGRGSSYVKEELDVCSLVDPFDKSKYIAPTQNLLDGCETIKGDFKLEALKLNRDIRLVDTGKMILTKVDWNGHRFIFDNITEIEDLIIEGNIVDQLELPNLKKAKRIELKSNSKLETFSLPNLNSTIELTISNNTKFQHPDAPHLIVPQKLKVECISKVYTAVSEFRLCTVIKGDFIIEGMDEVDNPKPGEVQIKEIQGCITVKKSHLTDLPFLENAKISCTKEHWFLDASFLCFPPNVEKSAPVRRRGPRYSCGKPCKKLSEGNCKVLKSNLIITDDLNLDDLKDLEEIQGLLIIKNTRHLEHLKFPSLRHLDGYPGEGNETTIEKDITSRYALQIIGNQRLKSVEFPNLIDILQPNDYKVRIENNRYPIAVNDLPLYILLSCLKIGNTICVYPEMDIQEEYVKNESGIPFYWYVLVFVATGGFAVRAAMRPWSLQAERMIRMQRLEEEVRNLERKHREEWRQLTSRQNKLKYDQIFFDDYMQRLKNNETGSKETVE